VYVVSYLPATGAATVTCRRRPCTLAGWVGRPASRRLFVDSSGRRMDAMQDDVVHRRIIGARVYIGDVYRHRVSEPVAPAELATNYTLVNGHATQVPAAAARPQVDTSDAAESVYTHRCCGCSCPTAPSQHLLRSSYIDLNALTGSWVDGAQTQSIKTTHTHTS